MARVLVVDDDPSVADAISRTLNRRGHETTVVHNGEDALRVVRTYRPELIVLDVVMPRMDGVEVCRRLRADPNTMHLPIIFLTARVMVEDKIKGFEAGADDYLTKPFAIQELELRVRALLRRTEQSAAGSTELQPAEAAPGKENEERPLDAVLIVGGLRLDRHTYELDVDDRQVLLTPVEFGLLSHLMEHPGEIFSSERLLHEVWGYPKGTGDSALVRMHIRNLRVKIEPENVDRPVYIRTVMRRGYTVRGE